MKKTTFLIAFLLSLTLGAHAAGPGAVTSEDSPDLAATAEFQAVHNKIMTDPQAMNDIQQMAQDPEIMALLSDPAFIAALQSGDMNNLGSDPRIKQLAGNPRVQALIEKLQGTP